jgi:transposase
VAATRPADDAAQSTEARIASLEAALAESNAQNAELREQVSQLVAQVQALTEQLGQNSKNSHLPPSSDGPGGGSGGKNDAKKQKKSSERKRGGQPGHPGAHRKLLAAERVDAVVDFFPDVCLGCAADLSPVADLSPCRYQVLDLRNHRPHLTEFRRHEVECPTCGARTLAAYDASIPSSAFGPCLTAVVGLLTGVYHLSRRKAQRLLLELFGISVSLGALSAMERRASDALETAYEEAKREVEHAAVKHSDATSWARSGTLRSLWTIATVAATVFGIFADGARDTVRPFFGCLRGILVSDRASVFTFWAMAYRQVCWAHLIRKFISFSERDGPAGRFGRELLEYAGLVFEYWNGFKEGELSREELQTWLQPVQRELERTLVCAAKADIDRLSGSCADILVHREALWTFVTEEGVEPTNNHAERELRGFVLWRKGSFGSQSERGERFAERLMTVAHTARKQGKSVLDFLVASLVAHLDGAPPPQLIDASTEG